jgi:hypothetical protein
MNKSEIGYESDNEGIIIKNQYYSKNMFLLKYYSEQYVDGDSDMMNDSNSESEKMDISDPEEKLLVNKFTILDLSN